MLLRIKLVHETPCEGSAATSAAGLAFRTIYKFAIDVRVPSSTA